jgi:hypothetical protein
LTDRGERGKSREQEPTTLGTLEEVTGSETLHSVEIEWRERDPTAIASTGVEQGRPRSPDSLTRRFVSATPGLFDGARTLETTAGEVLELFIERLGQGRDRPLEFTPSCGEGLCRRANLRHRGPQRFEFDQEKEFTLFNRGDPRTNLFQFVLERH